MTGDTFGRRGTDNLQYLDKIEKELAKVELECSVLRCEARRLATHNTNQAFTIAALTKTIARLRMIADLPDEDDNGPTNR